MAVCQYYLRGACRFGERCLNEHPSKDSLPKFGNNSNSTAQAVTPFTRVPQYAESIQRDLTTGCEKPIWPFSAYGPAKHEPNLLSKCEESPEELRVRFWQARSQNNISLYTTYEDSQGKLAASMFQDALNDSQRAFKAAYDASPHTPNPPATSTSTFGASPASGFGANSSPSTFGPAPAGSVVGQSSFSQPSSSAFGAPTTASAFASSSATGNPNNKGGFAAFVNKPSVFGFSSSPTSPFAAGTQASAFGRPSAFGTSPSAFGQSSAFGQHNTAPQSQSAFGQPQLPSSSFGQPSSTSTFGTNSAFGQPATSTFGQSAFGQSAFGQNRSQQAPAFGPNAARPSAFGTTPGQQSAFGQSSTPSPGFGQQSQGSVFGQPRPATQSAFDSPQAITQSAFGQPAPAQSAFGQPHQSQPQPGAQSRRPKGSTAQIQSDPYIALLPPDYKDQLSQDVIAAFEADEFEWGKIPDVVPPADMR